MEKKDEEGDDNLLFLYKVSSFTKTIHSNGLNMQPTQVVMMIKISGNYFYHYYQKKDTIKIII